MSKSTLPSSTGETALIFDVQRFSLHDGPGIRTAIFFKGCSLRCAWCQNPESHKQRAEMAFYTERCRACLGCAAACQQDAIAPTPEHRILYAKCNHCGACASACPYQAIRQIGRMWDVDSLLQEILRDKDFFEDSNGGVTLTGGEPTLQSDYLARLLPALKESGIRVTMETCGMFKWEQVESILPYLDLIYFDLKHMDASSHKLHTGQDNQIILENFARLAQSGPSLQARMPIIPGINDDAENISATARFLTRHHHQTIHCLPYHNFGEAKIPRIDTHLKPMRLANATASELARIKGQFEERGIHATIYD